MKFVKECRIKKGGPSGPLFFVRVPLTPAITIIIRFPATLKVIETTGEFLP